MCDLPPCPPCPPPPHPPCPQVCSPPPPCPPMRPKPIMRGLHWAQTKFHIAAGLALSSFAGSSYYFFVGRRRIEAYRDFHAKAEYEDWGDEMARKGLFQSVPKEALTDFKKD